MKQKDLKRVSEAARRIYDYGCYFMSLLYSRKIPYSEISTLDELFEYYDIFIARGWMDHDCYVKDPCAILRFLTGKKYIVKKDTKLDPNANIIIGRWHNPATEHSHFVVMDRGNNVIWDSLGYSLTVANGAVESYRLFYECK